MTYLAHPDRYETMPYRQCGQSGLYLPAISLGFWHNFGENRPVETMRAIMRRAFDRGVNHFDLANNYGPPNGAAETAVGAILREDFAAYRDELLISSKAGWRMWPGPYGYGGSRKYLIASCDASLKRLGVEYVDIFYHHRPDPDTPLEETISALDQIVRSGRALYVGISSYSPDLTERASTIAQQMGTPLVIHQPSYSMLNRWIEDGLTDTTTENGMGIIAFSPLAQGLLTSRYLNGIPADSRLASNTSLHADHLNDETVEKIKALNTIAHERGQSLAQMAIAWTLRKSAVTSALIGASSVAQLDENIDAINALVFTEEELERIDAYATESGINLWAEATESKHA
ncbi:L-glyceraldehyde 3-phosphate reductase [Stomatohabitans albus]|uniref:L-glyceraldehyde 3-phosphate reductase n=1 Tax=Stomatohabitans albus TaxID=3110766 RepID=UPI00300C0837